MVVIMNKTEIINGIRSVAVGAYLGFSLAAFANIFATNWRFYAILIPTLIFARWRNKYGQNL